MKKKATIITVVVVVVLAVGGWLFYRNQQTIPEQFANKNLTTYDPHQTDSVMENHLGMLVNIALGKNSGQIDASSPVFKTDAINTLSQILRQQKQFIKYMGIIHMIPKTTITK